MPSPTTAPLAAASPIAHAGVPAACKARFQDRIAVKRAAGPIVDMAGDEVPLRRAQGLLPADQNVLEIGCGSETTALRLAVQALRPGGLPISKTACISEMNPLIPCLALPWMRAVGRAPPVHCADAAVLPSAIALQDMDVVSIERHGTRGMDFRVFIVARKPA